MFIYLFIYFFQSEAISGAGFITMPRQPTVGRSAARWNLAYGSVAQVSWVFGQWVVCFCFRSQWTFCYRSKYPFCYINQMTYVLMLFVDYQVPRYVTEYGYLNSFWKKITWEQRFPFLLDNKYIRYLLRYKPWRLWLALYSTIRRASTSQRIVVISPS